MPRPPSDTGSDAPPRLGVYTDYVYHRHADGVYAERAFGVFLAEVARRLRGMVVFGRVSPEPGAARYRLPDEVELVELPWYESLAGLGAVTGLFGAARSFWRSLSGLDAVWLLGPHPLSFPFALLAALRGKRVYLGVRQDLPEYARHRHPDRRGLQLAARVLDGAFRLLSRWAPAVVVGPGLARNYANARDLLEIWVSLVREDELADVDEAIARRANGAPPTALSVGRLDAEKNPLLLAEILAGLHQEDDGWRLSVCGEGPLAEQLGDRLTELGVGDLGELHGYVEQGAEMRARYTGAAALIHTSWSEGLPQVLVEAFAAGLPVVATDVGGIREAVGDAALLVPPGDARPAIVALRSLRSDPELRSTLIRRGAALARDHTLEREAERVCSFLAKTSPG